MLKTLKVNKYRKTIIIILALIISLSFSLKLDIVNNSDIKEITSNTNYFVKILLKFDYSLDKDIFKSLLLFFLTALLLNKTILVENSKQGKKIWKVLLSLLFSFFMVFGYSYYKINSWDMIFKNTFQLFKASIVFTGYYILFRAIVNYIFDILILKVQETEIKESSNKIYNFIFVKHSFIIPLIIILICWLPYIIAYYPGILGADQANQIKQFFGVDIPPRSISNSVNLIDENVKITNHHPVLHTVIIGMCARLGCLLGNVNIGIFIATILQFLLFAGTLAYVIHYMKKLNNPNWLKRLTLAIFAILPIIPIMAVQVGKDTVFVCFFIIYIIKLYDLIRNANVNKLKVKKCIGLIVLALLVCLFRNNGIYAIIISLPFVAIIDKINRKRILIVSLIIFLLYESFLHMLLPIFKIPLGGKQEMLSIVLQQTARYVKEHGNEVTEKEKNTINKVVKYDILAKQYNPIFADNIKREYNKNATNQDLMDYFKVWFEQLIKHPTTYIQATMNNTYGYFYPESGFEQYTYYTVDSVQVINEIEGFDYHYIEDFRPMREFFNQISIIIQKIPVISWIMNIAFNVWIIMLIFTYLLYSKKYRYIIYLMPLISIIIICILSPVNAAYRYSIPFIFSMPLTVGIFIDIIHRRGFVNKKGEK